MTDFKIILKYLQRINYPNPKVRELFESLDYTPEYFLNDLVKHLGQEGADEFVRKTVAKLNTVDGIKIDLGKYSSSEGSYIFLKIGDIWVDLDESDESACVSYKWGEGSFLNADTGEYLTKNEVFQECDMQEWNDLLDALERAASSFFLENCGFYLIFQ